MSPEPLQVITAIAMLGITAALALAYREYLRAGSERRLNAMLSRLGADPAAAWSRRHEAATRALRQRCRSCPCEDVCERWLRGDAKGGNAFCPNAKAFRAPAVTRTS